MDTNSQQPQLAVLIDADNANAKRIDGLLAEVAKYGRATTKRAYGDWTNTHLGSWKQTLARHAIQPMQQFSNTRGKNSTDSALIIDAMDLLYTERFDGFCIVSSDSDFTRLASRIREAGLMVYGFGERKTPQPFVRACDRFIYVEVLGQTEGDDDTPIVVVVPPPATPDRGRNGGAPQNGRRPQGNGGQPPAGQGGGRPAPAPAPAPVAAKPAETPAAEERAAPAPRGGTVSIEDPALLVPLRAAVADAADEDGWAGLGAVGSLIGKRMPEFDPRNWGRKKLSDLFLAIPIFEVDERGEPGRSRQLFVREKRDGVELPATAPAITTPANGGSEAAPGGRPPRERIPVSQRPLPKPFNTPREKPSEPIVTRAAAAAAHDDIGWAPRRDERRPTWAVTPEPIVQPAAAAAAVPPPVAVAAAEPAPAPVMVAEPTPVAAQPEAVAPAEAPAAAKPARKTAAPRKQATAAKPLPAEVVATPAAPAKAAPAKAAPRKAAAKKAAAVVEAVADAPVAKRRSRATKAD